MLKRSAWTYGSQIDTERAERLREGSFSELAEQIVKHVFEAGLESFRVSIDPINDAYADPVLKRLRCKRVCWQIKISEVLLDRFFNGSAGIRGQYYASPYNGRRCTQSLIQMAEPVLVAELCSFAQNSTEVSSRDRSGSRQPRPGYPSIC